MVENTILVTESEKPPVKPVTVPPGTMLRKKSNRSICMMTISDDRYTITDLHDGYAYYSNDDLDRDLVTDIPYLPSDFEIIKVKEIRVIIE